MKLIDAEKLKNWIKRECNPYGAPTLDFETSEKIMDMINRMDNEDRWIPVTERTPETSGTYQVTCMDGKICRSTYVKFQKKFKHWELTGTRSYWRVTAWMPLPEPYRGNGNE